MAIKMLRDSSSNYTLLGFLRTCFLLGSTLIIFMVIQIQGATHHVIGDAAIKTISYLQFIASTDKVPLLAQHYDELATLVPLRLLFSSADASKQKCIKT